MGSELQSVGREETAHERADRNLQELLGELRVALPGVQVLFAFLLAVPFQQRFGDASQFQRNVYFGTLICTAIASTLLIAPSAYHRVEFRSRDKEHIVVVANRFAIIGFGFLGLAMCGAILLVTDFLFGATEAIIFAGGGLLSIALLWYVIPLRRRAAIRREREAEERAGDESPAGP